MARSPDLRRRRPRARDLPTALAFLAPMLVIYAVYFGYGFFFLIRTSFTKVSLSFLNPVMVGFKNYALLLEDDVFRRAILNNLAFGAIAVVAALTVGFFIAVAISAGMKPKKLLYSLFLVPSLMPLSLVSTIFGQMLQQKFGFINETLRGVGLGSLAQPWLTDPNWAFVTVAVLFCYLIGLPIMYYTADISALPTEAIEAALIDGAGTFRIMRSIIFPMMKATHTTVIVSLMLGSFRALEQVMFSTGGGPGNSTEIVGTYLYGFSIAPGMTTGFVSAAAVIVLLIGVVLSIVQMIFTRPEKER